MRGLKSSHRTSNSNASKIDHLARDGSRVLVHAVQLGDVSVEILSGTDGGRTSASSAWLQTRGSKFELPRMRAFRDYSPERESGGGLRRCSNKIVMLDDTNV